MRPSRPIGLLILLALAACSCREPATPQVEDVRQTSTPDGIRIEVRDQGFTASLPTGWTRLPPKQDGPDVFQAPDATEQLTITSMTAAKPLDEAKRMESLHSLVRQRQEAERLGIGPSMTATDPTITAGDGVARARYDGLDPNSRHRFATAVMVSGSGAWIAYFEAPDSMSEEAFRARAATMLDGVVVRP